MRTEQHIQGALVTATPKPPTPRLFRYATYGSPLPLLATEGPKHIVVYANPAFYRLSKFTHEELIGRPYPETVREAESNGCSALLDRVYCTGQAEVLADQEHSALVPQPVYWSYTAWAVLDEEEHPTGVMLQVSDTTEAVLFRQQIATVNAELLVTGLRQHEVTEATHRLNALLEVQATVDGLTGVKNHRAFQERLADEVKRSLRYKSPLSVLLMDVDNFKQYNDDYGHLTGDAILRSIGGILSAVARHTDMVSRYGGEEFAVILTETDAEGAKVLGERFRIAVETAPWIKRPVTISVGASTFSELTCDAISLIAAADKALYRSKHRGRNCVTSATDPVAPSPVSTEMPKPLQPAMNETLDRHKDVLMAVPETAKLSVKHLMVEGLSRLIGLRDKQTVIHSERVTELMARFAQAMGMHEDDIQQARWGALLHDIGKIGVPDNILLKKGPLTDDEWVVMKRHTSVAYEVLSPFPLLAGPAVDIAHYHHEKWAGAGYPSGLKGDAIPLSARMFAIVDVYDSLRSDRPYRKAWTEAKTRAFLHAQSGIQFEPRLVETFLDMLREQDRAASTSHA